MSRPNEFADNPQHIDSVRKKRTKQMLREKTQHTNQKKERLAHKDKQASNSAWPLGGTSTRLEKAMPTSTGTEAKDP